MLKQQLTGSHIPERRRGPEYPGPACCARMNCFYDLALLEVLDLWYSRKSGKYGVRCFLREEDEYVLWMTARQFLSFRRQSLLGSRDGIYARYCGLCLQHTFFGPPLPGSDYRLVSCFDLNCNVLVRPIPPKLPIPTTIEVPDELRDHYQN